MNFWAHFWYYFQLVFGISLPCLFTVYLIGAFVKSRRRPRTVQGRIVDKEMPAKPLYEGRFGALNPKRPLYGSVTVEIDGKRRRFDAPPWLIERLTIGQQAHLTCRGNKLVDGD